MASCLGLVVATVLLASSFAVEPVYAQSDRAPTNIQISRTNNGAAAYYTRNSGDSVKVYLWTSFKSDCSSLNQPGYTSPNVGNAPYIWVDPVIASAPVLSVCVVPQVSGGASTEDIGYDAAVYSSSLSLTGSDGTATVSWTNDETTYWRVYIWTSSRSNCGDLTGYQRLDLSLIHI